MARLSKVSLGLKRTAIREMNECSKEFPNVLSFAQGEPDFNTPPHIVESAIEAAPRSNLAARQLRFFLFQKAKFHLRLPG